MPGLLLDSKTADFTCTGRNAKKLEAIVKQPARSQVPTCQRQSSRPSADNATMMKSHSPALTPSQSPSVSPARRMEPSACTATAVKLSPSKVPSCGFDDWAALAIYRGKSVRGRQRLPQESRRVRAVCCIRRKMFRPTWAWGNRSGYMAGLRSCWVRGRKSRRRGGRVRENLSIHAPQFSLVSYACRLTTEERLGN